MALYSQTADNLTQSIAGSQPPSASFARVAELVARFQRRYPHQPPPGGHIRLRAGGRDRDILLGDRTRVEGDLLVLSWRTAPLARPFFTCAVGDDYELELPERVLEGVLLERHLLRYEGRSLQPLQRLERPLALAPRPPGMRRVTTPVEVQLDATQQAAVDLPAGRELLVLGEAGFGKTTVALRRLAALRERSGGQLKALVLVPTEGLRRLCREALLRLGIADVGVETVDGWLSAQARRLFDLPGPDGQDITPAVMRFKRHRAVAAALPALARERGGAWATRDDLFHLWGDGAMLARIEAAAGGALRGHRAAVLDRARVQFSLTTEALFGHVERHRLMTADGRPIDDGTPTQDAGSCDVEDYPVLFALNRVKSGGDATRWGSLERYDHVVVDEAQELAPLELAVIGRAVAPGGSLTVAGDERQQVDPTAGFEGWEQVLADLGLDPTTDVVRLTHSYRCPAAVVAFARTLFDATDGEGAAVDAPAAGAGLLVSRHDDPLHLTARLVRDLCALRSADPKARIAVICGSPGRARRLAADMERYLPLRVCLDGDFDLRPGVLVTCAAEVRGLEFDVVVVPDLGGGDWPDTPAGRRALNVAVTRATWQLWLAVLEPGSALLQLPDARGSGDEHVHA